MHRTSIRTALICFAGILLLIACTACKADLPYSSEEYLEDLAQAAGIGETAEALKDWGAADEEDLERKGDLDYGFLNKTVSQLIQEETSLEDLASKGWIKTGKKETDKVDRKTAEEVIAKAVRQINDPKWKEGISFEYAKKVKTETDDLQPGDLIRCEEGYRIVTSVDEEGYESRQARLEEVFSLLETEGSSSLDFREAEVIPYYPEDDSSYVNRRYHLLAAKGNSFTVDGFKVSYSLNRSGIDVHVLKENGSATFYADLSIYDVRPVFHWKSERNDLKNCFFTVSLRSTEEVGCSGGKYGDYYLKFKDLDSSSFKAFLDSLIDPVSERTEAGIPICKIRTPIPNLPFVFLDMDLYLRASADGNVRLVMYNTHNVGFETRNGQVRFIREHSDDLDVSAQASAKAGMAVNLGLDAVGYRLADVELDGGLKASVTTTLHLYDEDDGHRSVRSEVSYSDASDLAKENDSVKVCGDLSLHKYLDLKINTPGTQMNRLGFGRAFQILNEDDQVFGNLHHIENGYFVETCTRKERESYKQMEEVRSDRIVLDSYAEVLKRDQTFTIVVRSLPEGYQKKDLVYSSENEKIATVKSGTITALSPGSVRIRVSTSDGKFSAYVNILVSTG